MSYETLGKIVVTIGVIILIFATWILLFIIGEFFKMIVPQKMQTIVGIVFLSLLLGVMFLAIYSTLE